MNISWGPLWWWNFPKLWISLITTAWHALQSLTLKAGHLVWVGQWKIWACKSFQKSAKIKCIRTTQSEIHITLTGQWSHWINSKMKKPLILMDWPWTGILWSTDQLRALHKNHRPFSDFLVKVHVQNKLLRDRSEFTTRMGGVVFYLWGR